MVASVNSSEAALTGARTELRSKARDRIFDIRDVDTIMLLLMKKTKVSVSTGHSPSNEAAVEQCTLSMEQLALSVQQRVLYRHIYLRRFTPDEYNCRVPSGHRLLVLHHVSLTPFYLQRRPVRFLGTMAR